METHLNFQSNLKSSKLASGYKKLYTSKE